MTDDRNSEALVELTSKTRDTWNRNAAWWDEAVGEGDLFQRQLVLPTTERLLELQAGEEVLDIACGNGLLSRRMAKLGARVVACDFSEMFLERAKARTTEDGDRIDYRLIDATDRVQLLTLGARRFDAAVCNMALMDISAIDPLVAALSEILKPGGRFVFSVLHPCFNSSGSRLVAELEDRDGELLTTYSVKVSSYLHPSPQRGVGIPGQPVAQYYFNRPLSVLFSACFRVGFVTDGLEEPGFGPEVETETETALSWVCLKDIPPVLVARMRLIRALVEPPGNLSLG